MRAAGVVGGDTFCSKDRLGDSGGVSFACIIPLPISTEDLSLHSPSPSKCYFIRLHIRHRLVGNSTQHDRLFRRCSCKSFDKT